MNLDELRPILAAYREQVAPAWSAQTAHPGYDGRAGDPAGQCGVTSAWLQRRLWEDHGIAATYCVGDVLAVGGIQAVGHCWLEIGYGLERTIVDITAGQMEYLRDLPIVCSSLPALKRHKWIHYRAEHRLTEDQVSRDPVASRLAILTEALS